MTHAKDLPISQTKDNMSEPTAGLLGMPGLLGMDLKEDEDEGDEDESNDELFGEDDEEPSLGSNKFCGHVSEQLSFVCGNAELHKRQLMNGAECPHVDDWASVRSSLERDFVPRSAQFCFSQSFAILRPCSLTAC